MQAGGKGLGFLAHGRSPAHTPLLTCHVGGQNCLLATISFHYPCGSPAWLSGRPFSGNSPDHSPLMPRFSRTQP